MRLVAAIMEEGWGVLVFFLCIVCGEEADERAVAWVCFSLLVASFLSSSVIFTGRGIGAVVTILMEGVGLASLALHLATTTSREVWLVDVAWLLSAQLPALTIIRPTLNTIAIALVLEPESKSYIEVRVNEAAASDSKIQSGRKGLLVEGAKLSFALLLQCPEAFDNAFLLQSRAALCAACSVAFGDVLT